MKDIQYGFTKFRTHRHDLSKADIVARKQVFFFSPKFIGLLLGACWWANSHSHTAHRTSQEICTLQGMQQKRSQDSSRLGDGGDKDGDDSDRTLATEITHNVARMDVSMSSRKLDELSTKQCV